MLRGYICALLFTFHCLILSSLATYVVNDKGGDEYCLLLDVNAVITVSYNSTDGKEKQANINVIDDDDDVEGECMEEAEPVHGQATVRIKLVLPDKSSLRVTFVKEKNADSMYYTKLDSLVYNYDTRNVDFYDNPVQKSNFSLTSDEMNLALSPSNMFYSCNNDNLIQLGPNVILKISSVKVQVFDIALKNYSITGKDCADAADTTTVSPVTTVTPTEGSTTTISPITTEEITTVTPTEGSTTTESPITTEEITTVTPTEGSTTTESPITTEEITTVSTTEVSTTTTDPTDISTQSSHYTTSTQGPSTTLSPLPDASYFIEDVSGNVCLLLNFSGDFQIPYNRTDKKSDKVIVKFNPKGVKMSGFCLNETQEIRLTWRPATMPSNITTDWEISFLFKKYKAVRNVKDESKSSYGLAQVDMVYVLENSTFPNTAVEGTVNITSNIEENAFKAPVDKAYQCKANKTVKLANGNVDMVTHDFEVQAFRNSKTKAFDGGEVPCPEDKDTASSRVVPIVVGITLSLLIVAVLVAYFIGRRRNQSQNTYEQF
jgi:hypothetical protein